MPKEHFHFFFIVLGKLKCVCLKISQQLLRSWEHERVTKPRLVMPAPGTESAQAISLAQKHTHGRPLCTKEKRGLISETIQTWHAND